MKVKCIDNNGAERFLTHGKVYEAEPVAGPMYRVHVTDENAKSGDFFRFRFREV